MHAWVPLCFVVLSSAGHNSVFGGPKRSWLPAYDSTTESAQSGSFSLVADWFKPWLQSSGMCTCALQSSDIIIIGSHEPNQHAYDCCGCPMAEEPEVEIKCGFGKDASVLRSIKKGISLHRFCGFRFRCPPLLHYCKLRILLSCECAFLSCPAIMLCTYYDALCAFYLPTHNCHLAKLSFSPS